MAERHADVEKGVQELEKEITCAICHEHYTDPKVLSCCHYYCKQCIHSLALRTGLDKPFPCPECRADTTLPQGGVEALQPAFFINRMKSVHSKLELAHGKVEAKCEMCSEDKAEAFCRQCAQFICADCARSHKKMKKAFPGHKVSTLEELREGGAKEIIVQEPTLQMCQLHEEPAKIYCFDCSCLICRDCTIKDHRDHKYEFIKVAAPEMKKKLIQQLDPLRDTKKSLSQAVESIKSTKSAVEAQGQSVASYIQSSIDELHKILEDRKEELLVEAKNKVSQKVERLSGQEKSLSTACAVVQSVIDYTEQCVEHSADDEVMCVHAEIQRRIEREIEEQQQEGKNLEPVEEADMGAEVSCMEELKKLCQTVRLTLLPVDPTKCLATGKGTKSAEVNKQSEFQVKVTLSNGHPTKRQCKVECSLKTLASGSTSKCHVDRIEGGEYRVEYTPTVRGRHELTVTVNGQEIAGSPFPVLVYIPPTQLGKPVRVIPGLLKPCGVDITTAGEVIVACLYEVVIMTKTGTRIRCLKEGMFGMTVIYNVCVDRGSGCIYIAGRATTGGKIVKLNSENKVIGQFTNTKVTSFWDVAVVGDEVMACDPTKGIVVYTKDLEYVRQISGPDKKVYGMSPDTHGKLFVSNYKSSCIEALRPGDGELVFSFGSDSKGVKVLSYPRGVCVSGELVYVADWNNCSISVFTTAGEHVTTFGHCGDKEGEFEHPCGVCFDEDGLVYVCEFNNGRIQIL